MSNTTLANAKQNKQDEFYTQLADIENELKHYKSQFRGKIIFCNCDDPYESNFFKYFANNFNSLGLKKLIATSFVKSPIVGGQLQIYDMEGLKPDGKESYKIEINEVPDLNRDGAISLEDVQYLLKHNKNVSTPLMGDDKYNAGDFRSRECVELLKQADVVITNPPFSLFREFMAQLVDHKKQFLIIGSKNAITYKEIFKHIKESKVWLGHGFANGNAYFSIPTTMAREFADGVYDSTTGLVKFRNVGWFTNLDHDARHEKIALYKKYTPKEYPKYDNYDAINVDKTAEIPSDYYGVIGVPLTFFDKFNPDQFEIVGITDRQATYGYRTKIYTQKDSPRYNDLNRQGVLKIGNDYKSLYHRILIKRKDQS